MHMLNPFLLSVPMMNAYWCQSTDAGLQFCCSSGSSHVVCMSEYLEKSLLTFLEFLCHISKYFPSVRAKNKQ